MQYFKKNTDYLEEKQTQSGPKLANGSKKPRCGKTDPVRDIAIAGMKT